MPFEVLLTAGAGRDLEAIHDYIAEAESPARAAQVLRRLRRAAERLAEFPERGGYPGELLALGIRDYRQLVLEPYRMIYRIIGRQVFIIVIADSRRDMQALLARRLLGAD